jgi:6-pyruvoyl-tetrahydropterin synthase
MFAVEVRDHIMIAHSLASPVFGPAQRLHGATFIVDAAFYAEALDANGIVLDIGIALDVLKATLEPLRYQNLDSVGGLAGQITTTEFLCKHIFDALARAARERRLGDDGRVRRIRVLLHESHIARAWYEGDV